MSTLLSSEKLVLHSIVQDANRTDAEIANILGLKKGTVSSIRRRLQRAGMMQTLMVPSFNKLGCELFAYQSGSTNPVAKGDTKIRHYVEYAKMTPQIVFGVVGGDAYMAISVHRNTEDYEDMVQSYASFFTGSRKESRAKIDRVTFPFSHSMGTYIPNLSRIIQNHLKVEAGKQDDIVLSKETVESPDLSLIEKDVLMQIVDNPDASDRMIASLAKVSRQAVTRIRNRLEEQHIITRVCMPMIPRLGFEIFVTAHSKFSVDLQWDKRIRNQPREVVNSSFFTLTKPTDGVGSYLFSRFTEFTGGYDDLLEWYTKAGVVEEPPHIAMFPMERIVPLRMFEYGPALRHVLAAKKPAGK